MEFGYFTLTDNRYSENPRSAAELAREIAGQAVYAEEIGMYSAWSGEHHFNLLGCLPAPEVMLSYVAARRGPSACASHRRWSSCRCIIRSGWPSNGPRWMP